MKHQLLCTSAIALCVAASSAAAQEWDVKVGGFYEIEAFMVDGDFKDHIDKGGLDLKSDSEIGITPSITLDNGLSFSASLQIEMDGTGNHADDTFMTISGPGLGSVVLGHTGSAGYNMLVGAPNVTGGSLNTYAPKNEEMMVSEDKQDESRLGGATLDPDDVDIGYDVARFTYYTPDFNGLKFGISYAPDDTGSDGANLLTDINESRKVADIIDLGLGYSQAFGDANMSLGVRFGQGDMAHRARRTATASGALGTGESILASAGTVAGCNRTNTAVCTGDIVVTEGGKLSNWAVGASVTFGAVKVGGAMAQSNTLGMAKNANINDGDTEHQGFIVGASYDAPGPWSFSVTAKQGTSSYKEQMGTGNSVTYPEKETDHSAFIVGAAQQLGKGVKWGVYYNTQERGDLSSSAFGTSLGISF